MGAFFLSSFSPWENFVKSHRVEKMSTIWGENKACMTKRGDLWILLKVVEAASGTAEAAHLAVLQAGAAAALLGPSVGLWFLHGTAMEGMRGKWKCQAGRDSSLLKTKRGWESHWIPSVGLHGEEYFPPAESGALAQRAQAESSRCVLCSVRVGLQGGSRQNFPSNWKQLQCPRSLGCSRISACLHK